MKKLAIIPAIALLTLGLSVGPADAKPAPGKKGPVVSRVDSGWGCGGAC